MSHTNSLPNVYTMDEPRMHTKNKPYLSILCLMVMLFCYPLTGCVNLHVAKQRSFQTRSLQQRTQQRRNIKQWHAQGAFSLQQPGLQPILANFQWQQFAMQHYQLQIAAPLRAVVVTLRATPGKVTLLQAGEPPRTANSARQLLRNTLNWDLPVADLYYWLRAVPVPQLKASYHSDSFGHITQLQQASWNITYQNYRTIHHVDLPGLIKLSNSRLRLKIAIKQWQLNTP